MKLNIIFYKKLLKKLLKKYINFIIFKKKNLNQLIIYNNNNIYNILLFLKYNNFTQFKILNDICVIDYPYKKKRFEIIYNILSIKYNLRFFLKTFLLNNYIQSISTLYLSANWLERENWDLFGIFFFNHPDLRRILTDYGFVGHPFKKDFPINGYIELRFDEEKYSIVYEPIEIMQEYRLFNFLNPWENLL